MKRNTWNFWIDLISFLLMLGLIATGLLIYYVMPPGTGGCGAGGLKLWGMDRHGYGKYHFYIALALMFLMLIHVILHWKWACNTWNNLLGVKKTASGRGSLVGILILLLIVGAMGGGLYWAKGQIKPGLKGGRHERTANQGNTTCSQGASCTQNTTCSQGASCSLNKKPPVPKESSLTGEIHIDRMGQKNLKEISQMTGIPVERFIQELKLPAHVDTKTQLGQLRRQYEFEMRKVKEVIRKYSKR